MSVAVWNYRSAFGWSISESRFICQGVCTSIQGISAQLQGVHLPKCVCLPSVVSWHSRHLCSIQGGPLAKVGSAAKFDITVFKAFMPDSLGDPSAEVGLSAKFGVVIFKASVLDYLEGWGSIAKVGSSAKFCVLVFKANITCQSWNLLLSFGGCFGGVLSMLQDVEGVLRGLHLTWLYNAKWLFTTHIIQK